VRADLHCHAWVARQEPHGAAIALRVTSGFLDRDSPDCFAFPQVDVGASVVGARSTRPSLPTYRCVTKINTLQRTHAAARKDAGYEMSLAGAKKCVLFVRRGMRGLVVPTRSPAYLDEQDPVPAGLPGLVSGDRGHTVSEARRSAAPNPS
jgi:hypothetical protein